MKKVIELDEYFATGEATVQVILPWNNGRSVDTSRVSKYASHALDYIKNVAPEPGKTLLLLNAMGAEETYGPNRNGDGFPEFPVPARGKIASADRRWFVEPGQELPKHYQTFETNPAHAFKHHCFPAGTLIVRSDRTRVPIEDIAVGDSVATLEGPHPVTAVMRQAYQGPGVTLTIRGVYTPLTGTANHPVQIYRRENVHCPHRYNLLQPDFGCSSRACKNRAGHIGDPEWVAMSTVLTGDYLVVPGPSHGDVSIEPAFARLVGWVASEGYLGARGAIQFTFSAENQDDIDAVTACLRANGVHASVTPRPQHNTCAISACSKELHTKLSQYVVGTLTEKRLTGDVLSWSSESLRELLGAYIDGDGHIPKHGRNKGQLRIRSASPMMLATLSDIIRALGIPATVQWDNHPKAMTSPTNGETYQSSGSGVVTVEASFSSEVARHSRKKVTYTGRAARVKMHGRVFLAQVTDREDIDLVEDVYNFEVAGPHHYIANEVVVHNCNRDPSKASGVVKKAFWNPRMHRVELLTAVDNDKDPEWVKRASDGEFVPVSMGCRIKYDVCARCGNRAPTRADYCDHVKYAMNVIDANGFKDYVHNPSPDFFDISRVFRPADRTGYTLKKVADVAEIRLSADLGEIADNLARKAAASQKLSDIDKVIRAEPVASSTLTPDEKSFIVKFRDHTEKKLAAAPRIVVSHLMQYPLGEVLSAAAANNVVLNDREFMWLSTSKLAGWPIVAHNDVLFEKFAAAARYSLALFAERPELLDEILDSGVLESKKIAQELYDGFTRVREKRAYVGEMLYRRLVPEGVGLRPDDAPTTDVLHVGPYTTTRGAAVDAQDAVTRAHMGKVLGGGALMLGGYKALTAFPWMRRLALPLGIAGGALALSGRPGHNVRTDEGYSIPDITEMAPKTASQASIVHLIECAHASKSAYNVDTIKLASTASLDTVADVLGRTIFEH